LFQKPEEGDNEEDGEGWGEGRGGGKRITPGRFSITSIQN